MKPAEQSVLDAGGFALRPLRRSDMGLIEHYAGDARIARMTSSIPHPIPPGSTEAFVDRAMAPQREEEVWAMDARQAGGAELMGLISLERMTGRNAEIGYWVAPIFWSGEVASDAVRCLLDANPMGNDTIFGSVYQDNPASARVLTRCGFAYLGDAESYSVARDAVVPTWTYSRVL